MQYCKLTICFEAPFWIGLFEAAGEGGYRAAKHLFGSEPSDREIEEFVCYKWDELRFTDALVVEKTEGRHINHKRLQRVIAKEIAAHARKGTKAQQALAEQREATVQDKKKESRTEHEAQKQAKYVKRSEKRKRKHRGH